jgi:DNA-binding transcriptional LysR family regulator
VGRVRRVIVGAPSYLAQHGMPDVPEALQAHTIISANSVTPVPEWRLVHQGAVQTIKLHPRMITTTNDTALAAAVSGFGLTRLLSYQVADQLREGHLTTVLADCEPPALPVHVVHREGRHASHKARAFIDLAVERLRAHPALN